MNPSKNSKKQSAQLVKAAVEAVVMKKEMILRFENGENPRKIAKGKGIQIVFPI